MEAPSSVCPSESFGSLAIQKVGYATCGEDVNTNVPSFAKSFKPIHPLTLIQRNDVGNTRSIAAHIGHLN